MLRISHCELMERWALTYREDGYEVRAEEVSGLPVPEPINGVVPDLEATKDGQRVLVKIIEAVECLDDPSLREALLILDEQRSENCVLHVVVAAECASGIKEKFDEWGVHADTVHVT